MKNIYYYFSLLLPILLTSYIPQKISKESSEYKLSISNNKNKCDGMIQTRDTSLCGSIRTDMKNEYQITVWDATGIKHISNAKIRVVYDYPYDKPGEFTVNTSAEGVASIFVPTEPDIWKFKSTYDGDIIYMGYLYISKFRYEISKDGYYSDYGERLDTGHCSSRNNNWSGWNGIVSTLIKPSDYLDKGLLESNKYGVIKRKIMGFIDNVLVAGYISNASLIVQSFKISHFKNNSYLSLGFNSAQVYNSLKLNKYDIAKNLFDDVIRKILNPLNDNLSNASEIFGYDIQMNGYTKNFMDETSSKVKIEYRFYIPKNIVKKYKNKDISGQQLLDNSIITMDDERIELKLQ
jgi:hypothetical protein